MPERDRAAGMVHQCASARLRGCLRCTWLGSPGQRQGLRRRYFAEPQSPTGPRKLFKEVTAAHVGCHCSGFPGSFLSGTLASYGASTIARTSDRGHVVEVKTIFHRSVRDSQSGFPHLIPIGGGVMRLSHFICQTLWNTSF
jgi:hypothetical protein